MRRAIEPGSFEKLHRLEAVHTIRRERARMAKRDLSSDFAYPNKVRLFKRIRYI